MVDVIAAIVTSFGVVFVAELGDKTQLLALGFGAKHSLRLVAIGLALGYGLANLLAVIVGGLLGAALPERPIQIVSGLVFIGFAVLALRRDDDIEETDVESVDTLGGATGPKVVASIALAIAIAEMGDKTQITTATLASQAAPVGVWIGATLGAASSGMVGAIAGRSIGHRISTRAVNVASAVLFAGFGVAMLAGWF
ncbi:MAG TPA: TMEM165/GDT1 family protein [Ilumatobacteraceae bacterium]|nr:TMEM165/GDT1 family protein [Ilumatobacteraceae bacterium]